MYRSKRLDHESSHDRAAISSVFSPMDFHMRRGDHRFPNMSFQRAAGSALSSTLHENGGFFASSNAGLPEASQIYGLLQRRPPPMQTFDFKNYSSFRSQEWAFKQHAAAAAAAAMRAGAVNDHGPAKGLIHEMIFRKDGKPTSHLVDVRDAIISNRTLSGTTGSADHRLDGGMVSSFDWIGSSSRPISRTMSAAATAGFALGDHPLPFRWRGATDSIGYHPNGNANTTPSHPVVTSEALGTRLELKKHLEPRAPTEAIDEIRIETAAKRTKASTEENGWTADLQLSLSPNEGADTDRAKKRKSIAACEQEVHSDKLLLSLSLSLRGGDSGGEGDGEDAGRLEAATGSSSKKAALGLSTLDLTMSMKALE